MKNNFRPILIVLVSLILVIGIVVFAYREEFWNDLSAITDINDINPSSSSQEITKNTIDLNILKSETMKSLEKQVVDFDYNSVCVWPSMVVQTSDGFVSQGIKSCSVGTRLPFASEKKK